MVRDHRLYLDDIIVREMGTSVLLVYLRAD